MEDLATSLLAIVSTLVAGGAATVAASLKKRLGGLTAQKTVKICLVATTPSGQVEATAYRSQLLLGGYQHVTLSFLPSAALGADIVLLWKPAVETAQDIVSTLRAASPLSYLSIYTLDRLPVALDDRMMLSNSPLRLRADLGTIAEVVASEAAR